MAKKSNKAAGVAVAVGGVAALGLAAYALSQSKSGQKEASQLLSSGGYGGGATGGYSDAFTDVATPNTQPSISDTVADVLNKVTQTPQAQPTPIIITPSTDDLIPIIEAVDNPSDEKTDVKQGNSTRRGESATIPNTAGNAYDAFFKQLVDDGEASYSNGGVYIPSSIGSNAKTSTSSAVEYNPNDPFTFQPTSKQADYSSYNQGKTGGTANTPSKAQQEYQSNKVYDTGTKRSDSAGAQALAGSITSGSKTSGNKTSSNTKTSSGSSSNVVSSFGSIVSNTVKAASSAYQSAASAVGSFFSGLFGGK